MAINSSADAHAHVVDKTTWEVGPWQDEPDRAQWRTTVGLPGLMVRNRFGALCGYVGVAEDHPDFGKHYDQVDVDVHGGLTYAARCQTDGPICHVPEPGEPDNVWWFGFDCGHVEDRCPGIEALDRKLGHDSLIWPGAEYRNFDYLRGEVERLAEQLVERRG